MRVRTWWRRITTRPYRYVMFEFSGTETPDRLTHMLRPEIDRDAMYAALQAAHRAGADPLIAVGDVLHGGAVPRSWWAETSRSGQDVGVGNHVDAVAAVAGLARALGRSPES